jgi:hypothetical protein
VEQGKSAGYLMTDAQDRCGNYAAKPSGAREPVQRKMHSGWEKAQKNWKRERFADLYPKLGRDTCMERLGMTETEIDSAIQSLRRVGKTPTQARDYIDWPKYDDFLIAHYATSNASHIAAILSMRANRNITKNAVIGRANRLGLIKGHGANGKRERTRA